VVQDATAPKPEERPWYLRPSVDITYTGWTERGKG
jgi:hypothetical protein